MQRIYKRPVGVRRRPPARRQRADGGLGRSSAEIHPVRAGDDDQPPDVVQRERLAGAGAAPADGPTPTPAASTFWNFPVFARTVLKGALSVPTLCMPVPSGTMFPRMVPPMMGR